MPIAYWIANISALHVPWALNTFGGTPSGKTPSTSMCCFSSRTDAAAELL
ncbi:MULTISPECIES: hypothetical protein [Streptomyces]|nr:MULTISPECIES: hypothetical protein [Streptomyces]